jgi:glycerol-3-phosphate dehydrogenase
MRIAVIGAGVVGSLIARELARYDAEILLFDREVEVGFGVTKANSGIIHAGLHDEPRTLRARFCVLGNAIYSELVGELEFAFCRTGALVLAFNAEEEETLKRLWEQGEANRVPGLVLLSGEEVFAKEPEVNPAVRAGLFAPTVGITAPWEVAQAAGENAQENGAEFHLGEEVLGIDVKNGRVQALRTQKGLYFVDAIVNAAGLFADRISEMAGVPFPTIIPRRGEYILLDEPAGNLVRSVLFPTPSPVSKGILVIPTVDGGLLLGPTAEDLPPKAKEATETTSQGLSQVHSRSRKAGAETSPEPSPKNLCWTSAGAGKRRFCGGANKSSGILPGRRDALARPYGCTGHRPVPRARNHRSRALFEAKDRLQPQKDTDSPRGGIVPGGMGKAHP